jgi:hypothetical protein
MNRPHTEKTIRYYNQTGFVLEPARVREEEEDQRIGGEDTWKKLVILSKAGENQKYSQRIKLLGM